MYVPNRSRKQRGFQFTPAQILVLGFAGLILLGSLLLWLPISQEPGRQISYVDALFTATSAVCVTGLVVVDTAVQFSRFGELVVLGLIQAGGLGIMTLSAVMLLVAGKRISLRERLVMQEALGSHTISGVVRLTRNIIATTLTIEVIGSLMLAWRWAGAYPWPKALYWGFFHAISAFNNAGFDLTSASLRPFAEDPFILGVIGLLIVMGGLGFFVMEDIWRHRRWAKLSLNTRLVVKMTGLLIAGGAVLFLLFEQNNPQTFGQFSWLHKVSNALFASITPRTAGFESIPTGTLLDISLLLTIFLMFVGASPGGTGGGVKTTTFSMIALTIRATSTGQEDVQVMGRRLPRDLVDKAITVTAIAAVAVIVVTGVLLLTEQKSLTDPLAGFNFLKLLFETVSAFGTVGLSTGITPMLSVGGKLIISIMMYIGRVGPLTLAVALAQHKVGRVPIHFPEDRVMIG